MRQFDVFENPSAASRGFAPYLMMASSHLLLDLAEVVVAPLLKRSTPITGLEIAVKIDDVSLVLAITDLSSIDARRLRAAVANLADLEDPIRRAIERLFTGF